MSNLSEKVAYIKGLAEGMKLSEDTPEHKLLLKIIDALEDFAHEAEEQREDLDEMNDFVEEINEDLTSLEEAIYDEEEDGCSCCEDHDEDEEGDDVDNSVVEYECPHCGYMTHFDVADFDLEEDYRCPSCHQPLFPETEDDEDDEQEEDGEK